MKHTVEVLGEIECNERVPGKRAERESSWTNGSRLELAGAQPDPPGHRQLNPYPSIPPVIP